MAESRVTATPYGYSELREILSPRKFGNLQIEGTIIVFAMFTRRESQSRARKKVCSAVWHAAQCLLLQGDCPGARSAMADTSMIPSPPRPAAHAAVSRLSATSSPSGHTRAEHQWRRTVSPRT